MDEKKGPGSLQIYVAVFFAIALLFIAIAGFLQERSLAAAEEYGNKLSEQQGHIAQNDTMLKTVQEGYEELQLEHAKLLAENEETKKELEEAAAQAENLELLLEARQLADSKQLDAAREKFGAVKRPATEAGSRFYDDLEELLLG
ncbi:MAG TPA: hypothetical protein VN446_02080 [Candidatus Acidoferrum sp.]|nr:hypothetical protein [Candidatus Acidoferrum sp.]